MYRKFLRRLNELEIEVESYKTAVKNRPVCRKERVDAIFMELNCEDDEFVQFDIRDEEKFPQTISFLEELDLWKKRAEKQYTKVSELFKCFKKEVGDMTVTAEDVERDLNNRKWTARKVLATAGVAVGIVGGTILTGGLGLPVVAAGVGAACGAGAGIGAGVIVSSGFTEKETTHAELKKKLEDLYKKAGKLNHLAINMNRLVVKSALLEANKDAVCHKIPLLIELKEPFEAIFALMKANIDFAGFDELKKMIEQIEQKKE